MKTMLLIIISTLTLIMNVAQAQNCPSNPTYKNVSTTVSLSSSGSSYVANDGNSYTVTVQANLSTTSTICVVNGSTLNLNFSNLNGSLPGAVIYVDATSKLNINTSNIATFPFTINNYGTLTQNVNINYDNGAVIKNYGSYSTTKSIIVNSGSVTINNNGDMNLEGTNTFNTPDFLLNNAANATLNIKNNITFNFVKLTNDGTLNLNGAATFNSLTLKNSGTLHVHGLWVISNATAIDNYGVLDGDDDITINNASGVTNYCTLYGEKDLTFNSGNFTNYGKLLLKVSGPSFFVNQGTFVNGPNAVVQGYDFTNNSGVSGEGSFYFQHTTTNNGTFTGTSSSKINFYDASNTSTKYFDVQNITPQLTTKNTTTALATTALTTCGYPAPPAITTQPANVANCDISINKATFTVAASSPYSAITYQWRKNGVDIPSATQSSFTATGIQLADTANVYTVALTNSYGTTVSNPAGVKFVIVAQPAPASLYIATGTSATFTIKTSGATEWQWKKNGSNISGALAPTYNIAAVKTDQSADYTALVTYNGGTCLSSAATLKVEDLPAISTQPLSQQILCSGTKSISLSVAATSTSAMSYQWYKNGSSIPGATSTAYTVTGLTLADTANVYTVKVTNGVGATTSNAAGFKYAIVTQPASQSVLLGSSVTFAPVVSTAATGFKWQKDGKDLTGGNTRTYTISPVDSIDKGNYWVIVNYSGGSCKSDTAKLTVNSAPIITAQPAKAFLCDTTIKTTSFSVAATSISGAMTYQWRKNGVNIAGATSQTLSLNNLMAADTANVYTVAITNQIGTTVSNGVTFNYVILSSPSPASLYIAKGTAATFTIKTSAVATAWQWTKNGGNVSGTSITYTDASVDMAASGNYAVKVSYPGGTCISSASTLKVEELPTISTQPESMVLCGGITSATFSVTAGNSASAISYQWYNKGIAITGAKGATYTATNLRLADTANVYTVKVSNGVGAVTSNAVGFKYVIVAQPTSQVILSGSPVTFAPVVSTIATGYKWQKDGKDLSGGGARTYTIPAVDLTDEGNYWVLVNYSGGTCKSDTATLGVKAPPIVTVQPQSTTVCDIKNETPTLNVMAKSPYSSMTYQWRKNGVNIPGATRTSLTLTGLTLADVSNVYTVAITNDFGTTISAGASITSVITAEPTSVFVATGDTAKLSFTAPGTSNYRWYKNGVAVDGSAGDKATFTLNSTELTDAGWYVANLTFSNGTCVTDTAYIKASTVLYPKATGDISLPTTWGINTDGTGSSPVNFTRTDHTFMVTNRTTLNSVTNLTIAGKIDLANGTLSIAPNTLLTAGRIIRTGNKGVIAGTSTSSIKLTGIADNTFAGPSDLYFDTTKNTIKALYTAGHTVNLRSPLNLTSGVIAGMLQVKSGTFNTFNQLTLKSDSLGTAFVYTSLGTINGKVTVERFFPARRAYRFICSPVAANGAPSINEAWQEGAISSTDNPHPGYGTHITYGAITDGFDQNPQKSFSMFVLRNGAWYGVPPTKTTKVTDYPAYMTFIRGDRSYDITTTTNTTTPKSTILRTTGNLNQGAQAGIPVNATGFTLVANPYASLVDFDLVVKKSTNVKSTARVWDPKLAGTKGVGAYVTVDWTSTGYITTPPSDVKNIIPAGQGFWVQSADGKNPGTLRFDETAKFIPDVYAGSYNTMRQTPKREVAQEAMLEVNLKVINEDGSTGIADGILYHFADTYDNTVDENDISKIKNIYENLSISNNGNLLTVERRQAPVSIDTLQLSFTGSKSTNYVFEIVPKSFSNINVQNLYFYDRYLNTKTLLSNIDTTRITVNINTLNAASKDANRFSIVGQHQVVLPVTFSSAKAYAKGKTVQIEWKVATETDVQHYVIEKSANGTTFTKAGEVNATGAMSYSFNDATPFNGDNYYRVKSVDKSGKVTYTKILPVSITSNGNVESSLSIYPNPLKGKSFDIQLSNKAAGTYTLSVVSNSGQQLYKQTISYSGGTAIYHVQLKNALAVGLYFITASSDNSAETIKAIVQE